MRSKSLINLKNKDLNNNGELMFPKRFEGTEKLENKYILYKLTTVCNSKILDSRNFKKGFYF